MRIHFANQLMLALVTGCSLFISSVPASQPDTAVHLEDVRMRDGCVLANEEDKTYYLVSTAPYQDNGTQYHGAVRAYTSKDLVNWHGPHIIWETPDAFWPGCEMAGIWAPELHKYRDKYYLFLTFNTRTELCEQWPEWLPRVRRGTQILVGDSPLGPFRPFSRQPALPADMMTLDGTLWEEEGVPYLVYCHEWVQIVNGTVEMVQLKDDLSGVVGSPARLFYGNDGPWAMRNDTFGCWVTDGPSFHLSKSGKLFMIWSGFGKGGYTVGLAISDNGKLAGPWRQQQQPVFADDGGHGFIFKRFDGQLMMALHSPNKQMERIHLYEMKDTGESLVVTKGYPSEN